MIIIATDGQPTDQFGSTDIDGLERVLKYERKEPERALITFCACTDDDQAVGYLNKWDAKIPFVDVCDDYRSEREEIWRVSELFESINSISFVACLGSRSTISFLIWRLRGEDTHGFS